MTPALQRFSLERGFTLLELLVAIMILTLFMTASMGAVRIASRSWAAGQERTDMTEEMRSVTDFLRRQFAQMPPLTIGEGNDERLAFAADDKTLRFVGPGPQFSYGAGLFVYTLASQSIDGNESLTLHYVPFDPGSDSFADPVPSEGLILAWGFEEITFQYFGSSSDDQPLAWHRQWSDEVESYPLAIRIRTRNTPDGNGWPDLVYRLRSGERT